MSAGAGARHQGDATMASLNEQFVRVEKGESEEEVAARYPGWVALGFDASLELKTCPFGYRYLVLARED